jgi:deoxyribose-phosphate aldolase
MGILFEEYHQAPEVLENRIDEILSPLITGSEKHKIYRRLLGHLDMTTLEGSDTSAKVARLCGQARFSQVNKEYPDAAAICVYPALIRYARVELEGTGISIASVAGGFPSGQTSLRIKLEEIKYALGEGAVEIDTVISRGKLLEGKESEVFDELCAIREACGDSHLKVILETGELSSVELVRKASELALIAGADFIKTSTGKIAPGADPVTYVVMLDTVREHLQKTGKTTGIKPAGGIRTPEQALLYARLFIHVLGEELFRKDYFRIGASSLAEEFIKILESSALST